MVNVTWNDVGVLALDEVVHVCLGRLQRVSRYGLKYFDHQIPKSKSEYRPCVNLHQEKLSLLLWSCVKLKFASCTSN